MSEKRDLLCLAMDISGSFGYTKKMVLTYALGSHMCSSKASYEDKMFVGFTTVAEQYNSLKEMLDIDLSGVTYISSGLKLVERNIKNKYNLEDGGKTDASIDIILATDGDNWGEDNEDTVACIERLINLGKNVHVHIWEIKVSTYVPTIIARITEHFGENEQITVYRPYPEFIDCLNCKQN